MSDPIKHECGVALVRLLKPLDHYRREHGDVAWGLRRLYLLMEKQHNRGQDGAGLATVKLDMAPGDPFMARARSAKRNPVERLFDEAMSDLGDLSERELDQLPIAKLKQRAEFLGEVLIGHLRYGTYGGNTSDQCHPLLRRNIVASRNLALAGNFNMTNAPELFARLVEYGLHPVGGSDTQVVLERIGYSLDREHDRLHAAMGPESFAQLDGKDLADEIARELNVARVLGHASADWDGGFVLVGAIGSGDAFACRDPSGIRPCFYYADDEVVAAASERPALMTVFNVHADRIKPVPPGHVLVARRDGTWDVQPFAAPRPLRQCTFERVYFSRGNDPDIYRERQALGRNLAPRVLEAIGDNLDRAVFSFIPNTAETAYLGLTAEIDRLARCRGIDEIVRRSSEGPLSRVEVDRLLGPRLRREKSAHKDQRLRTFITHDKARRDLVAHVYDITRGSVGPEDTLVVVDDSIVRGTTLRDSIITMLSRLSPARIVVVSSAPPIAYPDCYGIDMSQLGRFIAFEAAVALLREHGQEHVLTEVEERCLEQASFSPERMVNHVAAIYEPFTLEQIEGKVAQLIRSDTLEWTGPIDLIYQSVEGLRAAMPEHSGDWYFTGA
ncbi:MAG: class II glutamine amidotransferase, partial [Phycisphaerales bacterium]|nr:class II glutamine amidotransferase [Phycisphaerales bacterium]